MKSYPYREMLVIILCLLFLVACELKTVAPETITPETVQQSISSTSVSTSEPIPLTETPLSTEQALNVRELKGYFPLFTYEGYEGRDAIYEFDPLAVFHPYTSGPSHSDIQFIEADNAFFLKPINGAVGTIVETETADYSVCEQSISSLTPDPIRIREAGIFICLMTDMGHLVSISIKFLNLLGKGSIGIDYVLYEPGMAYVAREFATKFPLTATPIPPSPTPLLPTTTPDSPSDILTTGFFRIPASVVIRMEPREPPLQIIDLDTGTIADETYGDITYVGGCGSDCFYSIAMMNEAMALVIGDSEPSFDLCWNRLSEYSNSLFSFSVGDYICVITNENHLAVVRIEALSPWGELKWIEVSFRTFAQVVDAEGVCEQIEC